jgi:hypothetical protein
LVFERSKYLYQQYISDLNGIDTKAHNDNPENVIREIRNWLTTSSRRTTIPGHRTITAEYKKFKLSLPIIVDEMQLDIDDVLFNDLCLIIEEYLKRLLS